MDLKVAEEGRVPEDDGGEQVEGGDALMSSYHMFAIPCNMLHQRLYLSQLSTIHID